MLFFVSAVYAFVVPVDEVEKDPITWEQLLKVEKAFDKAEGERVKAVAALEKLRDGKSVFQTKLKEGESHTLDLKEEIDRLNAEVKRLRLVEVGVDELK